MPTPRSSARSTRRSYRFNRRQSRTPSAPEGHVPKPWGAGRARDRSEGRAPAAAASAARRRSTARDSACGGPCAAAGRAFAPNVDAVVARAAARCRQNKLNLAPTTAAAVAAVARNIGTPTAEPALARRQHREAVRAKARRPTSAKRSISKDGRRRRSRSHPRRADLLPPRPSSTASGLPAPSDGAPPPALTRRDADHGSAWRRRPRRSADEGPRERTSRRWILDDTPSPARCAGEGERKSMWRYSSFQLN